MAKNKKTSNLTVEQEISRTIETFVRLGQKWILLNGLDLTEVPEELFSLTEIEYINLGSNQIRSIPPSFQNFTKLQNVNLIGNPLESLPDISAFISIDGKQYLSLSDQVLSEKTELWLDFETIELYGPILINKLRSNRNIKYLNIGYSLNLIRSDTRAADKATHIFLKNLADFDFLESLRLRGFRLNVLPESIRKLKQMKSLALESIGLKALPDWIGDFDLSRLSLIANKLSALPESLRKLTQLKRFDLDLNDFEKIPSVVFDLLTLESLSLSRCKIREIPADILKLTKLKSLEIEHNNLDSPPAEVASKGLDAIRDYWRQRADNGVDYLCEAKLIILGEPGAGKTSLARKIENPNYKLQENEESTEGIDVIRYKFSTVLNTRQNDNENEVCKQSNFQVNIWDFGGQEIYHATHQFFLTRRSVYVLVCDNRKEDTDFSYWLQVVEMLSDASPLIIVQNEKQNRTRDINIGSLRSRFGNLRHDIKINLEDNRGLDSLVRVIKKELEGLPHVGVGLPATWKRVREELETDNRDFITREEYLNICQQHGFSRLDDKLQLSGYLHDLGICLHFQDDPLLKQLVVLKPSWATDAVYRVLDDPDVINENGCFNRNQLNSIWFEKKYAGMQDELLHLMMKFQLCYKDKINHKYIAPQLLSSEKPTYHWQSKDELIVLYKYDFLPKGIVTRFIVAMQHLIAKDNLVWKSGVVLERDGTRAEIVEEYSQRRIRVKVNGTDSHGLLAIVDDQMTQIHSSFPKLKYKLILQCPCNECRENVEPSGFSLDQLKKMIAKKQKIQCHESGEMVDADQLVKSVIPGALYRESFGVEPFEFRSTSATLNSPKPEVFVSYAWSDENELYLKKIQKTLEEDGIRLILDREEVHYKDPIKDFMRRLGKGKCVVVLISEKYLKSINCMFEMLEILKAQSLRNRIFPIVFKDANIYNAQGQVAYLKYWENQQSELDKALKSLRGDNVSNLQSELNLISEIRRVFDDIAATLRDMNALSPEQHEDTCFEELINKLRLQLEH